MGLDKKQIKHIASLARLELTEAELEIYGKQLSDVLNYVAQLRDVDTSDTEPTAQVTGLENIWREDNVEEWNKNEARQAIEQAPELDSGQIKVRRVFE